MPTLLQTMNDSFNLLNPYEKAEFLRDKLAWVAGSDLCKEVLIRICSPLNDESL